MKFFKTILYLISFLAANLSIGQKADDESAKDRYRAFFWGSEQGLDQTRIYCLLKDVNGFLWIGTQNLLSRFDGSHFKNYYQNTYDGTSLASGAVRNLVEDSLHNIWIGTERGLSVYDTKADTFKNFTPTNINKSFTVVPFWSTKDEVWCIEQPSLITAYNIRSFRKKILLKLNFGKALGDIFSCAHTIYDIESNSIWILGNALSPSEEGLLNISLSTGKREHYGWLVSTKYHGAEAMCYDRKRNCIWINSSEGLMQFTLADKQFHHIDAVNYNRWVGIDLDPKGRVWLATYSKGLIVYDPDDQSVQQPFPEDSATQEKVSVDNSCVYCDRDGLVWTGAWTSRELNEILPVSPSAVTHYKAGDVSLHELSNNGIWKMINADHGKIWIGTFKGLNIFDPIAEKFELLQKKDLPGVKGNIIIPVLIDTTNQEALLIAGSYDNRFTLFEMNLKTRSCHKIMITDSAGSTRPNVKIYSTNIKPFRDGIIFFNEGGVSVFNTRSKEAQRVLELPNKNIDAIATDEDHFLFLKSAESQGGFGLTYKLRGNNWVRISTRLDSIPWGDVLYNKEDSSWWVGTDNYRELLHFDKNFNIIYHYTEKDGLPGGSVKSILFDNRGNIWFNTNIGYISRLNLQAGKITTLTEIDGYQKNKYDWEPAAVKDSRGDLYFSSNFIESGGIDRIRTSRYNENFPPSSVYLQSLEINQEPLSPSIGLNSLQTLSLKHFENQVTIETGTVDYYSNGKSSIRYKLEANGEPATWQYAPDYYTIRYDNLPPGNYKLTMQAGNAANEFNGPQKILFINITPAFWNTWWFRALAAIFILVAFYVIVRYRAHQKFRLQLERSEKEKQLAELQHQKAEVEMQALRAQMNPHFIFNSLNSINRFILKKQSAEATEYLTKFSRLIRMILDSSANTSVSLAEDLEALQLYLELERLRCEEKFSFKIKIDPDIDIDFIKVPPMLLQPFVENAIWHGLMNKEGEGHLLINIQEEDSALLCTIADDGIGRKKSAESENKSGKHKSMGMKITESRIAMMQKMNREDKSVEIRDLVDAEGNAAGTEVVLKIPIEQ